MRAGERGGDPRRYTMFVFGGNGPLFAATMAAAPRMKRILVPPAPGLFSAEPFRAGYPRAAGPG